MNLLFLGTGAADWDISLADSSPEFRRNSSLLIDGKLLIDPGACIFEFEKTFGYESLFGGVTDVINTHKHSDHWCPDSLSKLEKNGAAYHPAADGDVIETADYIIRAYAANHGTVTDAVHFVVESKADGKRLFYGCDGAWMFYPTYRALCALGHIDMMIFDGTIGDIHGDYRIFEHNNAAMVLEMKDTFSNICGRFMVSHLARTLHGNRAETDAFFAAHGVAAAYDNMRVEI